MKRYRGYNWLSARDMTALIAMGLTFFATCFALNALDKCDAVEPVEIPSVEVVEAAEPVEVVEEPEEPVLVSLGEFKATAYCACVKCCGIWSAEHPSRGEDYVQRTASGTVPEEGRTIAADWGVLPKGTEVIVNGQTYTVEDTGSGVNGKHIDVFFADHQKAREWGLQMIELFVEEVEA